MIASRRWLAALAFLAACTTTEVQETAEKPANVVGTIVGQVTSLASGRPLAGVEVSTLTDAGRVSAATDATGAYALAGLPAGATYQVRFALAGHVTRLAQTDLPGAAGNVALANPIATVNLTLAAADASLAGTVSDGAQPLAGAVVAVDLRTQGYDLLATATTDAGGTFRIDSLPSAPSGFQVPVAVQPYDANGDGAPDYQSVGTIASLFPGLVTQVRLDLYAPGYGFSVVDADMESGTHPADTPLHVTFSRSLDLAATSAALRDATMFLDVATEKQLDATGTQLVVSAAGGTPLAEGHQYQLIVGAVSAAGETRYLSWSFVAGAGGTVPPPVSGLAASPASPNYDTRSFTLTWDAAADAAQYRVYARDTRSNPSFVALATVGTTPAPQATVSLPATFDYYSGDGLQTPFAWGTEVTFAVVAVGPTGAPGDVTSATPVRLRDAVAPSVTSSAQSGSAANATASPQTVTLQVTFDEYMDPATAPAIDLPVAGLSPVFAMDPGLRKGTFTLTIPTATDATGPFTVTGAVDTSGNAMRPYSGRLYRTQDLIANGGFETGDLSGWTTSATQTASVPAATTTAAASGSWSARLGNATGSPENGVSTLWQDVALPAGAASIRVSVSYRPFTNSGSYASDRGWCGVYTPSGGSYLTFVDLMYLQNASSFATATAQLTPALAGQTVRIQCSVQQFGAWVSGMYVDDLSVVVQF